MSINMSHLLTDRLPLTAAQRAVINVYFHSGEGTKGKKNTRRRAAGGRPHLPALVRVAEDLQVVVWTVSRALQQQPHAVVEDLLCGKRTPSVRSRRGSFFKFLRLIKIQVRRWRTNPGCNPPDCDDDSC